jgi:membrane-bound ClpP family serine protease
MSVIMQPRRFFALLLLAFGLASLPAGFASAQTPEPGPIDIVEVDGLIDPPMARFIIDRVRISDADGAQLVVLRLDSAAGVGRLPLQGLDTVLQASEVPIVAWVAPRGAVARGVAASIAAQADVAFEVNEAPSLAVLLQAIDGRTLEGTLIESWDEERGFPGVLLRFQELPLWDRLLHAVATPAAALFLILLGIFGLIFETYNPGIGIAAGLGAVLLALGFYALDVLPTNWWALLLITASLSALVYDVHVAGLGPLTIGGLIGVGVGSALLFPSDNAALDVNLLEVLAAVVLTIVFFVSVMTAALRVRLRRPIEDSEGVVGSIAEAQTDIAPEGTVLSNGTLWRARTMETGIAAGSKVEVKATEGLVLLVEPLHEEPQG